MRQQPKLSEPPSGDRVHPRRSGTQAVQELQPLIGNRAVTQLIEVARQPAKTKKKPAGKPFYQEVYDAIAEEKKGMVRWKYKDYDTGKQVEGTPFGGFAIPFFRALERLAKAVEAGDKPLIKKELEALFKMDAPTSAPYFISDELGNQLVSRMIMLGLDADAAKLRAWVRDRNRGHTLTGSFGPDERLWEMTVQRVLGQAAPTKDKAGENLEQLMRAFRAICKEIAGLDPGRAAARSRVTPA